MNDDQLDALVVAADDGVDCDGLRVGHSDDGYRFETPDSARTGLEEAGLRSVAGENPWFVSNWYYWSTVDRPTAETAFLRWLEGAAGQAVPERYEALAEGIEASWGELAIEVTLGNDGHRTYAVRHAEDADREYGALDVHADPLEARELVKYDERGRYRPLKTAPTLQTGWAFVDLDGRSLVRAVGAVFSGR